MEKKTAPMINERLVKQLIRRYQRQIHSQRPAAVLHTLIHEIYAQGQVEATRRLMASMGEKNCPHCGLNEISATAPASTAEYRHLANDWAGTAYNGLQWLRNIKDGMPCLDEALTNMEKCVADMAKRWPAATAPVSAAEPPEEVSEIRRGKCRRCGEITHVNRASICESCWDESRTIIETTLDKL